MYIESYYRLLLDKVRSQINSVGEISFEDLRNWAKGEGIGLATLTAILNDLLKDGKITAPQGFIEVEGIICSFIVPKVISTSMDVLSKSTINMERELETQGSKTIIRLDVKERVEVDLTKDIDLKRSIEYLNKYHSVGVIRFLRDLSEMGVSNPEAILKKLISLGHVTYSPYGVINASPTLPKISDKRLLSDYI